MTTEYNILNAVREAWSRSGNGVFNEKAFCRWLEKMGYKIAEKEEVEENDNSA